MAKGTVIQEYNNAAKIFEDYEAKNKTIEETKDSITAMAPVEKANRKLVALAIGAATRDTKSTFYNKLYRILIGTGEQHLQLPAPSKQLYDRTASRGHDE